MPDKIQHQKYIRIQYRESPITLPVSLEFSFFVPIPKSTSKVRRLLMLQGKMRPITRKDLTNYIKFTEDCLKGIVIEDDCQVVALYARKIYGDTPHTEIIINPLPWS